MSRTLLFWPLEASVQWKKKNNPPACNCHANNFSSFFVCSSDTCCSPLVFSLLSSIFHATESASILSVLHALPPPDCQNIIFYHSTPLHLLNPLRASRPSREKPCTVCCKVTLGVVSELFFTFTHTFRFNSGFKHESIPFVKIFSAFHALQSFE